jgi:hypothetical protein
MCSGDFKSALARFFGESETAGRISPVIRTRAKFHQVPVSPSTQA